MRRFHVSTFFLFFFLCQISCFDSGWAERSKQTHRNCSMLYNDD